jgi:exodeoxyribonuclease V alpha subunit
VALAAPTGKAANRVKESIESELARLELAPALHDELARAPSFTLHRLLGYRPDNPTRFRHDRERPLPYDVVVVDEASMVSFAMMTKLVDAVPEDARLILLGDRDQLASVEAGAVLGDICNPRGGELRFSRVFAERVQEVAEIDLAAHATLIDEAGIWDGMVQLDRFYRFGERSGIGGVARAIQRAQPDRALAFLRGEATEAGANEAYADVALIDVGDDGALPARSRAAIVDGYRGFVETALASETGEDALDALDALRVLCAHRRGPLGVEVLNPAIERWLADAVTGFTVDRTWYTGRPVIVTENDYGLRLFNGDVGVVVEREGRRVVAFRKQGGGVRELSPARLPPCETVFAMSIHKSQGSQFEHAIVVLPAERSRIVTRELVYTGVTRARERVSVVAREEVLREAIDTPVRRASGLRDQLWPGVVEDAAPPSPAQKLPPPAPKPPKTPEPEAAAPGKQLDLFSD